MGLNIAYAVATYIVALLICKPLAFTWDSSIPGGHCGNRENLYLWHGIQNLLYDVILVGMPMPLLWKLHMPMGKKISLIIIFAMALMQVYITTMLRGSNARSEFAFLHSDESLRSARVTSNELRRTTFQYLY